jgi:uncharacterized protein (TIGR00251 family)
MGRASEENYFFWDGDTLVVNILGRPAATKDAIGKPKGNQLKVSVTASPQHGRATDHMLRFLAPLFGVRERDIALVFGRESVHKQIRIKQPQKWPAVFGDWPGQPSPAAKVGQ